jgi:hypothetical protein
VQCAHVALPLPQRQVDVDWDALDVGDQPFGYAGAGTADEGATVHPDILSQPGRQVLVGLSTDAERPRLMT